MIVTEIYNGQGLGNQLWCYITTRCIAADRGYDFGIQSPEKFKCNHFMRLNFGTEVTSGAGPEGGPPTLLPDGITYYYKEKVIRHPISNADISTFDYGLTQVPDNTKIDGTMQDERYILRHRNEIREWLKVRSDYECYDFVSDDICVLNFRGGEYVNMKNVFLPQQYWDDAVHHMRVINPNFKFVVITDDVKTAKKFFPKFEVFHFNIAKDYVIIKNAKYLILSNSSFAWFPAWLNENLKFCIAPKFWWAHNISDGYWACDYNITSEWNYLDNKGNLSTYENCFNELQTYKYKHEEYYKQIRISKNFLVVSNYNNDITWVPDFTDQYIIYDQGTSHAYPPGLDRNKVINSPHLGHNIRDYLTFIIDNYDKLPANTIFVTGNIFPRHVSREYFSKVANNSFFTPLIDRKRHSTKFPTSYFDNNGIFCEENNSWYLLQPPKKYFYSYNDFLKFCFINPTIPKYVSFAPGANYIVPKKNILRYPKIFYENLRKFVSYSPSAIPGESYLIERAFYTIWTCNFEINPKMLEIVNVGVKPILRKYKYPLFIVKIYDILMFPINRKNLVQIIYNVLPKSTQDRIWRTLHEIRKVVQNVYPPQKVVKVPINIMRSITRATKTKPSKKYLEEYRKTINIYDAFYFFNELDILEIRLHILDPFVDYFVIVEATETFSGMSKPLFYQENRERFKKFNNKIIHFVTHDTPSNEENLRKRLYNKKTNSLEREIAINSLTSDNVPKGQAHWLKEFYQKENLKKALTGIRMNDFCYISDVDEIWNPEIPIDYSKDYLYKYKQTAYYYYLNNKSNDNWETGWTGTVATKYKNIKNGCINHLRNHTKNTYHVLNNGGWHFTFQGGQERIKVKLASYGHQEFNTPEILSKLNEILENNKDYRGRKLKFRIDNQHLPKYILENREKYSALIKCK